MKDDFGFNFDFDFTGATSDKLQEYAKKFLLENDIRESVFNKKDIQIIDNVLSQFRLPEPGEQIRIRTQQQINLISLVLKTVDAHKIIDELTISTYTFNRKSLESVSDLVRSGGIKKLNMLISSSYSFRDPKYFQELKDQFFKLSKKYDVHLSFVWLHFKITLMKCGGNFYQHEGSMNYSTNNMAEQLLIENSGDTYDHDYDFLTKIIFDRKNAATEVIC